MKEWAMVNRNPHDVAYYYELCYKFPNYSVLIALYDAESTFGQANRKTSEMINEKENLRTDLRSIGHLVFYPALLHMVLFIRVLRCTKLEALDLAVHHCILDLIDQWDYSCFVIQNIAGLT